MQGRGLISGDDGRRYSFVRGSVQVNSRLVLPGQNVDFAVADNQAFFIYVIGGPSGQLGQKSKTAAGLLAIFLGGLGIHKFYIGANAAGVIMLLVSLFGLIFLAIPTIIIGIIALIEGIIYLTKTDQEFYQSYEADKKAWF